MEELTKDARTTHHATVESSRVETPSLHPIMGCRRAWNFFFFFSSWAACGTDCRQSTHFLFVPSSSSSSTRTGRVTQVVVYFYFYFFSLVAVSRSSTIESSRRRLISYYVGSSENERLVYVVIVYYKHDGTRGTFGRGRGGEKGHAWEGWHLFTSSWLKISQQ